VKPIGPYVAARDLTGEQPAGTVRTLRATDRLTGMPVLLHVLPHVAALPDLPDHPALLRPSEGGLDGDVAYVVTELPPHALPASDPLLAARGALAGLAALHAAGQTHGGVAAAQLWSVDGRVALAGAGLPWGGEPTPAGDVDDLLAALKTLGGVPPALRSAAAASAGELLARLDAPAAGPDPHDGTPIVLGASAPQEEVTPSPASGDAPVPGLSVPVLPPLDPAGLPSEGHAPSVREEEAPKAVAPAAPTISPASPARRRTGEPVKITWDADGTRRVVKPDRASPARSRSRRRLPGWLRPALALLVLLVLAVALWARQAASRSTPAETLTPATLSPACCAVRFVVSGGPDVPVRLSVLEAPPAAGLPPGREVGQAPGVVHLPRPGTYVLRVAAEGFTPGSVTVTAPSAEPVTVALAP
jgi:hypothetical protein